MILMYHNENVTSPVQDNKPEHCTDISTPSTQVIICTMLIQPCQYLGMSTEYAIHTIPTDISFGAVETRILNSQDQEGK